LLARPRVEAGAVGQRPVVMSATWPVPPQLCRHLDDEQFFFGGGLHMSNTGASRGSPRNPLTSEELRLIDAWWRAANYLAVGMIYLRDNPLLEEPLKPEHIKHRLLGHWGASPALSFIWAHLNRVIKRDELDMIFIAGPGHGAPGVLGPTYLEGTYSEVYPDKSSANPHSNGGLLRKDLKLPDFRKYAVDVAQAGKMLHENTKPLGEFLRDVLRENPSNFRVFGPDETASNRLQAVYEASKKTWMADYLPEDADGGELARDGRVMEMLSEHTLIGWLEGYLLTGRHGFFHTYEAFAQVVDSMFNQHAKWLDICKNHVPWRAPVSSQNILLSSTVWRQDHNGFSHQDPGFIDLVTNKSPSVTRVYLPPDANTLLAVADHCLRSTDYINVIVADKQKHLQFTTIDEAIVHCTKGIGILARASNDQGEEPDVVLASCGDVATQEALAAVAILREHLPDLKVRFVNVVDLFKMQPATEHPHGSTEREFDSLFTVDKPVIFNFHGYPWLIHKLAYRFRNHENMHVRGYKERGNINTPLELAILNQVDRFNLVIDVIDRVPALSKAAHLKE
jgi:xylulose-5-phosphate/fructose-6-phosphate phosphoketolase